MLCLAAAVGDDDAEAVAAAVGGGALALVQRLMASSHPACLVPAAEALQVRRTVRNSAALRAGGAEVGY